MQDRLNTNWKFLLGSIINLMCGSLGFCVFFSILLSHGFESWIVHRRGQFNHACTFDAQYLVQRHETVQTVFLCNPKSRATFCPLNKQTWQQRHQLVDLSKTKLFQSAKRIIIWCNNRVSDWPVARGSITLTTNSMRNSWARVANTFWTRRYVVHMWMQ